MSSTQVGQLGEPPGDLLGGHVGSPVVEPVDGDAGVHLVAPVTRAASQCQASGLGSELPPVSVIAIRTGTAQDHAEVPLLVLVEIVEVVGARHRAARGDEGGSEKDPGLLGDLDEARGAAKSRDPIGARRVDLSRRVHVVGIRPALVVRVVPMGHERWSSRVAVDMAEVALGEHGERELVHVLDLGLSGAVGTPRSQQIFTDVFERPHLVRPAGQRGRRLCFAHASLLVRYLMPRARRRSGGRRSRSPNGAEPS